MMAISLLNFNSTLDSACPQKHSDFHRPNLRFYIQNFAPDRRDVYHTKKSKRSGTVCEWCVAQIRPIFPWVEQFQGIYRDDDSTLRQLAPSTAKAPSQSSLYELLSMYVALREILNFFAEKYIYYAIRWRLRFKAFHAIKWNKKLRNQKRLCNKPGEHAGSGRWFEPRTSIIRRLLIAIFSLLQRHAKLISNNFWLRIQFLIRLVLVQAFGHWKLIKIFQFRLRIWVIGMAECLIRLERNDCGFHYAGQLLKGTVELHLNEPRMFRGEPHENWFETAVLSYFVAQQLAWIFTAKPAAIGRRRTSPCS